MIDEKRLIEDLKDWLEKNEETECDKSYNLGIKTAINEIKKQSKIEKEIPKKAIKLLKQEYGYTHQCPSCGQLVGTIVYNVKTRVITDVECDEYCCSCGQRLDWSD